MGMDNLIRDMNKEGFEHIAQLFVAKILQKSREEQLQVVNTVIDALYAPHQPRNERLERLFGFLREIFDGLDDETSKLLTRKIMKICLDDTDQQKSYTADSTANLPTNGKTKVSKWDKTDRQ